MNGIVKNKNISYILPWIQWIHIYAFVEGITLGYIAMLFIDLLFICNLIQKGKMSINRNGNYKWMCIFFVYLIFSLLVIFATYQDVDIVGVANRLLKLLILYMLIILSTDKNIDWECYKKSLKVLVYIACFAICIQFLTKMVLGYFWTFKVPFLRFANQETDVRIQIISTMERVPSIFTEPSYFVYLVFQYLIIVLFERKDIYVKNLLSAAFISFCVLLSVSSTGYILLAFVWTIYLYKLWNSKQMSNLGIVVTAFIFVAFIICIYLILTNDTLNFAMSRLASDYERSDVVWKRVDSGWDTVLNLSGAPRFIGYGMGNTESEFMNSMIYLILNTGFIGAGLIVIWLIDLFFKTKNVGRISIILLAILAMIDMVLFTPTALGYLYIANHYNKCNMEK